MLCTAFPEIRENIPADAESSRQPGNIHKDRTVSGMQLQNNHSLPWHFLRVSHVLILRNQLIGSMDGSFLIFPCIFSEIMV